MEERGLMAERAIVLLSGGLDSAVCLWWAREQGWELYTISFNYHQRNQREAEAAEALARAAGVVEHRVIDLPFLKELKDVALEGRSPLAGGTGSVPPTYIPARNTVFYAIAASWAEILGARWLVGGHNSTDFRSFPDSTPEYFELMNRLLKAGTWTGSRQPIEIVTPLSGLDKVGIVRLAMDKGVPVGLTWSCHERGAKACGACHGCRARMEAFKAAGFKDLIKYEPR